MSTKLTEAQLALMTKVRNKMTADFEADIHYSRVYICHNIALVENGLERFDERNHFCGLSEKEGSLTKDLVEMISEGIGNQIAFDSYLDNLEVGLNWVQITKQFAQLGRLAWLDRIVATGEIA